MKKLRQLDRFIAKYATWCPENSKIYALLMESEFARLGHNQEQVLALYEQAIELTL